MAVLYGSNLAGRNRRCRTAVQKRVTVPQPVHRPAGAFYGVDAHEISVGAVHVGVRSADPTRHIPRHQHEDAHFVLVLSGHYVTSARDQRSHGPQLIYNPPGTTHADTFVVHRGRPPGAFLSISLPPAFLRMHDSLRLHEDHARVLHHPLAIALARKLACIARYEPTDHLAADAAIWELIGLAGTPADSSSRVPPWLHRALAFLLDGPTGTFDVQQLAAIADVHPVYLARAFRQHVGMSPGTLHRRLRLARAGALLRDTRPDAPSLSTVAALCGFADQAHLTRTMRAVWGVTPAHYRRAARR